MNTTRLNSGVTVVSTAPMGNLAEAIRIAPDIKAKISAILTSSGYYGVRKLEIPPRCTWNIRTDPMATKIVLESGIEIRAIGLEITSRLSDNMVDEILKERSCSVRLAFFIKAVEFSRQYQIEPSSLLVDAVAAAYAVDSSLAHFVHGKIKMDSPENPDENFTRLYGLSNVGNNSNVFAADSFQFRKYIKMLENRVFR
ncbi:nucleoside hydrolase [Caproicibacter fermentans]|uniref:nucleoside hydrolase n=1 Tax=Caproicibacter fermentans TaxID=2576756 RepID=UPI00226B1B32|nr:nucleoside hydrolase [Caproicibacter fermentans]